MEISEECPPVRKYTWFSREDVEIATKIIESNDLSGFLATPGDEHHGGTMVKCLERKWESFDQVDHAIAFNSWTSGLEACVMAFQFPTKSEIVTTPWTMSATTSAIANSQLIPVFADINPESYNIDVATIDTVVTKNTVAILAVDIFGLPCDAEEIRQYCRTKNLKLIIDSAQTPLARRFGKRSSVIADAGGYSFNRHKHIQSGEGGLAVTNDAHLHHRMMAIRNHAEISAPELDIRIQGRNLRFGEIEASLVVGQLERIHSMVQHRRDAAFKIMDQLSDTEIRFSKMMEGVDHDFYILAMNMSAYFETSTDRKIFVEKLKFSGVPGALEGYVDTSALPKFRDFPRSSLDTVHRLQDHEFFGIYMCGVEWTDPLIDYVVRKIKESLV